MNWNPFCLIATDIISLRKAFAEFLILLSQIVVPGFGENENLLNLWFSIKSWWVAFYLPDAILWKSNEFFRVRIGFRDYKMKLILKTGAENRELPNEADLKALMN